MSGRRGVEYDTKVMRWMCDMADAISAVGPLDAGYGVYDLADIRVTFDHDPNTGLAIFGSEHGNHFVVGTWVAEDKS